MRGSLTDELRVATWNMGGGERTGPTDADAARVLTELRDYGCSIVLGQEAQEAQDRSVLRELGYSVHRYGHESVVAWDPKVWAALDELGHVLNPTHPFHRKGGSPPIYQKAARVILGNRHGQTVDALSYHLPSSVQLPDPPPNRVAGLHECMDTLAELAHGSRCHGQLYGGDDNVDESGPFGPWGFMLGAATGLRQLRAPRNTLGHRRVDDFRVSGLVPIGEGRVVHGPTDHNAHVRRLRFADPR